MKPRLPPLVFLLLTAGFLVYLWKTQALLPERVATHFDIHGRPDGWMTRESTVKFMALIGLGVPLILIVAFTSSRFVPSRFVNLPNREYWLSEERREESLRWIASVGTWFACLLLIFMGFMYDLVVRANQVQPPHLDSSSIWGAAALEGACVITLIVALLRRFGKPLVTKAP